MCSRSGKVGNRRVLTVSLACVIINSSTMQQQQPKQPSQPVMPPRRPAGPGGSDRCPVIELKPGMKNLNTKVIVLDKGRPQKVQSGPTLQQFLVADATGMIYLTLYDEKAEAVDISDIIEIKDGCVSQNKPRKVSLGFFSFFFRFSSFGALLTRSGVGYTDIVPYLRDL